MQDGNPYSISHFIKNDSRLAGMTKKTQFLMNAL